jgi:hypothetical protein
MTQIPEVDLVFNCYEQSYPKILTQKYISEICEQNCFKFTNVIIIINNVNDRAAVEKIAKDLVSKKVISLFYFVEDYLDKALKIVGLRKKDLGRLYYYYDWSFVIPLVSKSKYILHWDAEVFLTEKVDWITPSLKEMEKNDIFFAANPASKENIGIPVIDTCFHNRDFYFCYGFSDQVYLVRRKDLLKPIYRNKHLYTLRFPLYFVNPTFEARIDSYMRRKQKLRLIFKHADYSHPRTVEGESYPKFTLIEMFKWIIYADCIKRVYQLFFKTKLGRWFFVIISCRKLTKLRKQYS